MQITNHQVLDAVTHTSTRLVIQAQCLYGCGSHAQGTWYDKSDMHPDDYTLDQAFERLEAYREQAPRGRYRLVQRANTTATTVTHLWREETQ